MQSPKENIKYIELEELEDLDENDDYSEELRYNNYIIIITIGDENLKDLKIDRIFNIYKEKDIILYEYYQEKLNKQSKPSIHDHMNIDDYNSNITIKSKNNIKKLIIFYFDKDDTKFNNNIYYYNNYDLISEIFNFISSKPTDAYNIGKKYILEKENQRYICVEFISIIILLYKQENAILIIYYSNNTELLKYLLSYSNPNGLAPLTQKKPSIRCNKKIFLDLYNTFNIIN
jgi:hypothetical protein